LNLLIIVNNSSLKIAQPFMAGFTVRNRRKSRQGRKNCSAVPAGLDFMMMTLNPAINGWAIFSEDGFSTACRVMAKRLRDVCGLPESELLWRAGRGFVVRP
jgi:hypothetical protein